MSKQIGLRLKNDYFFIWPIWEVGAFDTDKDEFRKLISAELYQRLINWTEVLQEHLDPFEGWTSFATYREYLREGRSMANDLQEELGADYYVLVMEPPWVVTS